MSKAKVMIVDDEADFAETLAVRLRMRGYDMHVVTSPADTLLILEEIRPDVLLLDLRLPGISGVEILMTVPQICQDTNVILLTGHLDLERQIEGLRLDSFHYIMKPIDIKELIEKIDTLSRGHE